MHLSVVVPTLNGRDRLADCLEALDDRVPEAEIVVVNGPSTDGTTGMVRGRDSVDVLLEIPERNVNVARNAGIRAASGEAVALLDDGVRAGEGWFAAVDSTLGEGADAVTGPRRRKLEAGTATTAPESERLAGRTVTYFDGGNVAFATEALSAIDGFDEYLQTGGARDAAQRLAGTGHEVEWASGMVVHRNEETGGASGMRTDVPRPAADSADLERDWGWKYRSLAYRLVKNYGVRPSVIREVVGHALADAVDQGGHVFRGDSVLSRWLATGRTVVSGIARGAVDGARSRRADRSPASNPNGLSAREDRPIDSYDRR
ncbi:MAG: glycosyltransferase [Halobacteriales archaeon]